MYRNKLREGRNVRENQFMLVLTGSVLKSEILTLDHLVLTPCRNFSRFGVFLSIPANSDYVLL